LSQKNIQKNKTGEKSGDYICNVLNFWSEISCSFVQHQAVIIFKNSKHNISSTLIIFSLNYSRKAIPNVFLAVLFPFSDFFTFFGKKLPFSGKESGVKCGQHYKIFDI
jgi:hypothetical protein